jgi:hypothetical protein
MVADFGRSEVRLSVDDIRCFVVLEGRCESQNSGVPFTCNPNVPEHIKRETSGAPKVCEFTTKGECQDVRLGSIANNLATIWYAF